MFSGGLCETETVVKLRPTQSRYGAAPNNDLNVTTDDTSCVCVGRAEQEPKSICSSAMLRQNGLKEENRGVKKKKQRKKLEGVRAAGQRAV